jgi:hypothetical protein
MKRQQASDRTIPPGPRVVAAGAAVLAASLAAGLLLLSGGWAVAASPRGAWVKAACRSPLFLVCGLVTAGCVAGLALLCGAMWAAGASARAQRGPTKQREEAEETHGRDAHATHGQDAHATHGQDAHAAGQDGSAILEFTMVLPIALMVVMIMIQSSLLMGGNLCVNYAAFCAARSAIVNVPRDLPPAEPLNVVGDEASSAKLQRIKLAAVWALLPVSSTNPDGPTVSSASLESALDAAFAGSAGGAPPWVHHELGRRMAYAQEHTFVTLDAPPPPAPPVAGGAPVAAPIPGAYAPGDDVRVRVRHDFYLSVPYAALLFSKLAGDGMQLDFGQGNYALIMRADCTLTNEGDQDFVDVERFPRDRISN